MTEPQNPELVTLHLYRDTCVGGLFLSERELDRTLHEHVESLTIRRDRLPAPSVPTQELEAYLDPADALLDQGVTRLQLLAFLRGDDSTGWNWNGKNDGPRWVRFRGHVIDRWDTLDGQIVRLTYTEHDGVTRPASWTMRQTADLDYNAAAVARNIDQIIDAAIAHHGPDGVA